jgi:hypothetical protein
VEKADCADCGAAVEARCEKGLEGLALGTPCVSFADGIDGNRKGLSSCGLSCRSLSFLICGVRVANCGC